METIVVTELHAVPTICPTCGSYFHRYLDQCPSCSWPRAAAYMPLMTDPLPSIDEPLPRTKSELGSWLASHDVSPELNANATSELSIIDDREPLADRLISAVAAKSIKGPNGEYNTAPYSAAVGRFFAHKLGRTKLREMAEKLTYRYQGGVPDFPGPTDSVLTYADGYLLLRTSRGEVIARIAPERVLFATSFVEQTGTSSLIGLSFGHVIYFPDDSFIGGALRVIWSIGGGATNTFVVGNREGWTTRKGEPGFYFGLVQLIGSWANMGAYARQAEIGLPPYARELGFDAPDPIPEASAQSGRTAELQRLVSDIDRLRAQRRLADETSPETGGVIAALTTLNELLTRQMITDDEYQAKRAEILRRL